MHIEHETGELMAALGEEMRIPLEVLESDLQLLRTPSQVVTSLDAVRHSMERQVRHLTRVCDDLFDAGRIANGEFHLHREYVALNQVLLDACDDTGRFFRHYDQEMTLNMPDRTLGVEGDASRLLQVFVTLLHLAAKVTPRNGRIRVVLERQAGRAVVGIRCLDDETGNQPQGYFVESDARLEANNQVQQPEPSSENGFGVSLNLVKRIIELHDGMVKIERNGVGYGVEFTVALTVAGESLLHSPTQVSEQHESLHVNPSLLPTYRILVMDDDRTSAELVAGMLRSVNQHVTIASDSLTAIQAVLRDRIQVVILDNLTSAPSGGDMARWLRQVPEMDGIYLIALSASNDEKQRLEFKNAGVNRCLAMPTRTSVLAEALHRMNAECLAFS